jgi:predicted small integral membrane protein
VNSFVLAYIGGGGGVALLYAAFFHAAAFNVARQHLWGGVIFGATTSLLPWLLLLPAFGWGWFGRWGPRGANALLASTVSHIPYGLDVGVVMALGSSL